MNDTELSAGPSSYEVVGLPVGFPDVLGETATGEAGDRTQTKNADAETRHVGLLELTAKCGPVNVQDAGRATGAARPNAQAMML